MAAVTCPSCDETVRLPATDLPEDSWIECPWCGVTLGSHRWLERLPPKAILLGPDGKPLTLISDRGLAPSAAAETDRGGVDATDAGDQTVELDEPQEQDMRTDASIVGMEESDEGDEIQASQPTIDEIEDAWENAPNWDSSDSSSQMDAVDEDLLDEDLLDVVDRSAELPAEVGPLHEGANEELPFDDDQSSYLDRHQWERRGHGILRLLMIASPTLLAVPVILGTLYFAGVNLGFYPLDGSSSISSHSLLRHTPDDEKEKRQASLDAPNPADDRLSRPSPVGVDPKRASGPHRSNGHEKTTEPAAQELKLLGAPQQADAWSNHAELGIDEVIQSVRNSAVAPALTSTASGKDSQKVTAQIAAEQQHAERQDSGRQSTESGPVRQTTAAEEITARLNRSLLVFPAEPPSADSSAGQRETESTEVVAACGRAIASIDRMENRDDFSQPADLSTLVAYRAVSRLGALPIDPNGPMVLQVLSEVTEPVVLAQFEPLCLEWIRWAERKTDGILLIGRLQDRAGETVFELVDGTRLAIDLPPDWHLPRHSRCAAIGKMINPAESRRIELIAGVEVR